MSGAEQTGRFEPQPLSFDKFPASALTRDGMHSLAADHTPRYGTIKVNVPYAEKSGMVLHLNVVLPPTPHALPEDAVAPERYPLIVYVQGSAWFPQQLGQTLPALADFSRRGYVVAVVEYRPSTVAPFPAQVRDTGTAIRFLRAHADEFLIDPDKIALWGDSSGGHTVAMTYATEGDQEYSDEPVAADPLNVRCFIDYFGPTDFSRMNDEPSIQDHLGPTSPEGMVLGGIDVLSDPDRLAPSVVMNHITSHPHRRPILIAHGTKDRLVPFGQSVRLYDALLEAGQDATFYRLDDADHGGPPFWQPELLDIVDEFIRTHV